LQIEYGNTAATARVILQHCLPQGWVARISIFIFAGLRLCFHKHPYHLCLYTLTAFEKHTIRFDAPREKEKEKLDTFTKRGPFWLMHTPFFVFGF